MMTIESRASMKADKQVICNWVLPIYGQMLFCEQIMLYLYML